MNKRTMTDEEFQALITVDDGPDVQARIFATRFLALTEARRARAREAELEAKVKATVAALVAWGHDSRCAAWVPEYKPSRYVGLGPCDCGMDKIVADLRGTT